MQAMLDGSTFANQLSHFEVAKYSVAGNNNEKLHHQVL